MSLTPPAGRTRKALFRFVLIIAGIGVGLLLCEIGMRASHLGSTRTTLLYNNRIYKPPPHARFMNYDENKNLVETNNLGFHDYDRAASNEKYRILVLGDSFVEGRQVKTENLFTSRLERELMAGGRQLEVINGGVPATGTAYQYVLWKEFFEPSIKVNHVALCFFMGNDLTDNNRDLRLATFGSSDSDFFVDNQGNIEDATKKPGALKRTINYLRGLSVVVNASYEGVYRLRRSLQRETAENLKEVESSVDNIGLWEASEQGTISLIKRWKSELNGKNVPFDLVLIDRPGKVYNKFELQFLEKLQTTCLEDGIDCLRLKLEGDPYDFYSFDGISLGHFNDKGHDTVARELYDFLQARHPAIFKR